MPVGKDVQALMDVVEEMRKARIKFPPFNSAHEAYAVLLEEVEETWMEIKLSQKSHATEAMRAELIQVAAMAICAIVECC